MNLTITHRRSWIKQHVTDLSLLYCRRSGSWDITKLKGPARGIWYLLYVILDIFSRKVIGWEIWPTETGTLAREFIARAIENNGGLAPLAIHADRGTSMTSN